MKTQPLAARWALLGGVLGVLAIVSYFTATTVPLPKAALAVIGSLFGPLLAFASIGFYQLLTARAPSIAAQLAVVSNIVAGALVNAMIIVQLAVRHAAQAAGAELPRPVFQVIDHVQLGLDISWDTFICLGTFLFGLAMLRHPRFGRIFGASGMLIAAALFVLNFWTFPTPPGQAGLVDLGPLGALWYFAVSIQALRSQAWARQPAQAS